LHYASTGYQFRQKFLKGGERGFKFLVLRFKDSCYLEVREER
jgi:hypothetical protein